MEIQPLYSREDAQGIVCGFMPEHKNLNGFGAVHGGALMTFADFALFRFRRHVGRMHGVTVAFTAEFLARRCPARS
ncbi:hotdog domain-containing protein [Sphingomonas sp. MMS24-JH45]